jgi:ABC-type oligopeptide transport system ATPase subunit
MKKLKRADLKWSQIHNQREKKSKSNRDIDKSRSHLNYDLANNGKVNYQEKIDKRLKEGLKPKARVRKDSVLCNSWVITSDRGFFDRIGEQEEKRFFKEAYKWFANRYGKENIAFAVVHRDEHTPHMHLGVVPVTKDGRLSSKDRFNQKELLHIQDEFPKYMQAKGFDLKRGIPGKQKHMEPVKWKNLKTLEIGRKLNKGIKKMEMQKKDLEEVIRKLTEIGREIKPVAEMKAEPMIFGKDRVKVLRSDWESLKAQAVEVVQLRADNERLQKENLELRKHLINKNEREERLKEEVGLLRSFIRRYEREFEKYQKQRQRDRDRNRTRMIDLGEF